VPLCDRHSDLTTPPMGWAMNDLRSSRKPEAKPEKSGQPTITRKPPRSRPTAGELAEDTKELRRKKARTSSRRPRDGAKKDLKRRSPKVVIERTQTAQKDAQDVIDLSESVGPEPVRSEAHAVAPDNSAATTPRATPTSPTAPFVPELEVDGDVTEQMRVPLSRPSRRRAIEAENDDASFPWHHQFEDDEPEELQATSPLLSRAFRATTG